MEKDKIFAASHETPATKGGIDIGNAGLVLINNYVQVLFSRLGLMQHDTFTDAAARDTAVHCQQYAVTGLTQSEDKGLPLNKLICGLPVIQPVGDEIEISAEQRKTIDGLILAMIDNWPALGKCSVNGFRDNWLVRQGLLAEQGDKWELTVEKRAYDLLINMSPFTFSIIKYPWMSKPLHVMWPG